MLIILWMAVALMFALIGIGILWWEKNENLSKKEIIKNFLRKVTSYLLFAIIFYGYKNYLPFNKNHGIEFNNQREKLGVPKIEENWKHQSNQFTTYWRGNKSKDGHIEKIIEYGIFDVKSEIDYYKNSNDEKTIAWSKYNFSNGNFEYFVEEINNSSKENRKKPLFRKIKKNEFEKYKTE